MWRGPCQYQELRRSAPEARIERIPRARGIARGELVYAAGDPADVVAIVCDGRLKLYEIAPSGKILVHRIVGPGSLVGLDDVMADGPHHTYAEAAEKATVAFLDRSVLVRAARRHPPLVAQMMADVAVDLERAQRQAVVLSRRSAETRIFWALRTLSAWPDGRLHVYRIDLAELAGLTVENTVRTLKELERRGLVELGPDHHTVRLMETDEESRGELPS